jgi:hypothetical protein
MLVSNPPVMTQNSRGNHLTPGFWLFGVAYQIRDSDWKTPNWQAVLLRLAMGGC